MVFKVILLGKEKPNIGIRTSKVWDENLYKDKGEKTYIDLMKRDECTNLFTKFITRNEYIGFNQVISKILYAGVKNPGIIFYKTLKDNCKYIDEKDENGNNILEKFGEATLDIEEGFDINKREIKIDMKMGGTYIYTIAKYLVNGKYKKTTQNFIKFKKSENLINNF